MSGPVLVVGLGNPDRGDDAVGATVARRVAQWVARTGTPGVRVVEHEDPTLLPDLWAGHDVVVVVDAVVSGAPPGRIHRVETGAGRSPEPGAAWAGAAWSGTGGTHAFGLATAVELARALGCLPPRLAVVGVEAGTFGHGEPLSPEVAAAVEDAVGAVLDIVGDRPTPSRVTA